MVWVYMYICVEYSCMILEMSVYGLCDMSMCVVWVCVCVMWIVCVSVWYESICMYGVTICVWCRGWVCGVCVWYNCECMCLVCESMCVNLCVCNVSVRMWSACTCVHTFSDLWIACLSVCKSSLRVTEDAWGLERTLRSLFLVLVAEHTNSVSNPRVWSEIDYCFLFSLWSLKDFFQEISPGSFFILVYFTSFSYFS